MADLTGTTLGRYRIINRLGRGGLAEVYKAYQPSLDRHVAIKVLSPHLAQDAGFRPRFEREASILGRLRHPNIVQALDFDREGDMYFMAMEFIDGPTLKDELKARKAANKPFTLQEVTRIFIGLCSAIDYAHSRGMVHRDLKPANVMINQQGQVVLTDFGIARIVGATQYTQTGALLGTPSYMSPEQGQGERADERSDIYSLGVMLYEMVTGMVPYDADTPFAVIMKHTNEPLPMPRKVNPAIPEAVELVILKAMSKNPDDRYQTAEEMAQALQQAVGAAPEPVRSFHPPAPAAKGPDEVASAPPPGEDSSATLLPPPSPAVQPVPPKKSGLMRRAVEAVQQVLQPRQEAAVPAERAEDVPQPEPAVANLRLDAAVPDQVRVGRAFDVAVAVRQLSSPLLAEDDLSRVRSGDVQVSWPEAEPYIHLRIAISAPECEIHGEDSHAFRLYPRQDSPVFYFHLTPRQEGDISIIVTVYQEDDWLGSARVRTVAQQQVVGQVNIDVTSHNMAPPPDAEVESLRQQLRQHRTNLNKLQEQAAVYALGETPLHLLNQIEAEETAIAELEAQLAP